jgi:hypothetical protein
MIPDGDGGYDVIVVGSGMAGLGATFAAAQLGARTLLLEANSFFGGVTHTCLWMPSNRLYVPGHHDGEAAEISRGGVHQMLTDKLKTLGSEAYVLSRPGSSGYDSGGIIIHPDYLRVAIFQLLEELGCHYRLNSPVTGVTKDGERVTGVVVTGRDGVRTYSAKAIVDASGDAIVAHLAGAESEMGRPEDGMLMPVTLTFVLGNVDHARLKAYKPGRHETPADVDKLSLEEQKARYKRNPASVTAEDDAFYAIIAEAREQGYATASWYAFTPTTIPGVVTCNNSGLHEVGNIDGTKMQDLTLAERVGAQIATDFVEIAHTWQIPGLERCHLVRLASHVAVRESRRVVGDYTLTVQDLRQAPDFDDVVAINYEGVVDNVYYHGRAKMGTQIPYCCLLPKGVEGLLVSGRSISATYEAGSGIRGQGTVMAIGQAAGAAAALASREGTTPRALGALKVQAGLRTLGAELEPQETRGIWDM